MNGDVERLIVAMTMMMGYLFIQIYTLVSSHDAHNS